MKWLFTAVLTFIFVGVALCDEASDAQTLSPYFLVEGGESAVEQFPLKETEVDVSIAGVLAHVRVSQVYTNGGASPINAKYVFPASTRAAVHGMTMTIGDAVIRAKIEERKKAQQAFETAKEEGKSASLLEQQRPNVFSMNVANVMPGDEIRIELEYSELLTPSEGVYEFMYPTVVGPRYSELTTETATAHDQWIKNPYLHEGEASPSRLRIQIRISTGIPLNELNCNTHQTDILWDGKSAATVSLADSEKNGGNRDFILRYSLVGKQIESGLLLYEGEEENFFLLMAQPPARVALDHVPPREYVFVVDVSGSMNGFPLTISKTLLRSLIGALRPTDTFNVVLFAGTSSTLANASLPATPANIRKAISVIDQQKGGGGTRLTSAMERAFSMPHEEGVSRSIIVVTDGYISAEKRAFSMIRNRLNEANVFAFGIGSSVNRYLIEGLARVGRGEPFVVTRPHEAPAVASKLQAYVQWPVLTDISFECDGFDAYAIEPPALPDLMAQRPIQIIGKWRGEATGTLRIHGANGAGTYDRVFDAAAVPPQEDHRALRYLWARTRVADLSDFGGSGDAEDIREITSLGLTYDLLTKYTSFIAVHDVVRNEDAAATDVTQPLPLPEGVSDLAVGACPSASIHASPARHSAPEPELLLMLAFMICGVVGARLRLRWIHVEGDTH